MIRPNASKEYLNFQADRIEHVLATHKVPARVQGGTVSPRWIRFYLAPSMSARFASVRNLSEELASALGARSVRVAREGQALAVEVAREDPEPVGLLNVMRGLPGMAPLTACLGVTDDGRPLLLRLPSPEVEHILVCGQAGAGKTELIRSIVVSLALTNRQSHLQLALVESQAGSLRPLETLPHLMWEVASDAKSAALLLDRLLDELRRRESCSRREPRILIVVDELSASRSPDDRENAERLTRLTLRGQSVGLHVLASTPSPPAAIGGPLVRANFRVRLVGRVESSEAARLATGLPQSGAEKLEGRGDFLAVASRQLTRFQAAWIPVQDWAQLGPWLARGERFRFR